MELLYYIDEQHFPERFCDFAWIPTEEINCSRLDGLGRGWDKIDFHGGITFSEDYRYYHFNDKRYYEGVKVGCDYDHIWNYESNYRGNFRRLTNDAKATIDQFVNEHPDMRLRCCMTGKWDIPENFREHSECMGTQGLA